MAWFARTPTTHNRFRDGRFQPCPNSPNCISTQANDATHYVDPYEFTGSIATAQGAIDQILEQIPRCRIIHQSPVYWHAEIRSRWFRFVDDLELWIDVPRRKIHLRSASRWGYSDLGVNRKRAEHVFSELTRMIAPSA